MDVVSAVVIEDPMPVVGGRSLDESLPKMSNQMGIRGPVILVESISIVSRENNATTNKKFP